ncbi:hypothetical protein METUNv1_02681 [Methyloversatilis universalis FAM5]|uniref:Uncharacterized protein n=1 Tax=Methyloversatilis universalis (strain ATCC BAA-1314 / DSM 25237 / JCM 13912 / CCUG 52030 / FAM5) TaxID=1000565 RepID=F5REG0_METUF|nr:hypothetical protein METUNv1_02681 [Methyloversatilis universalis FAM5]
MVIDSLSLGTPMIGYYVASVRPFEIVINCRRH